MNVSGDVNPLRLWGIAWLGLGVIVCCWWSTGDHCHNGLIPAFGVESCQSHRGCQCRQTKGKLLCAAQSIDEDGCVIWFDRQTFMKRIQYNRDINPALTQTTFLDDCFYHDDDDDDDDGVQPLCQSSWPLLDAQRILSALLPHAWRSGTRCWKRSL